MPGRFSPAHIIRKLILWVALLAVISSAVISILYTILASIFLAPLCRLFGATENLMPYALRYGHIIVIGFPFAITATVINSAIRTDGSPRYAMFSMMISP